MEESRKHPGVHGGQPPATLTEYRRGQAGFRIFDVGDDALERLVREHNAAVRRGRARGRE